MNRVDNIFIANRLDPILMETLFNFLKADCAEYKDLTKSNFIDCDIYVYTVNKVIKGIIGLKRTTMKLVNIDKLDYYINSNNTIYSIEFMHVFDTYDIDGIYNICNKLLKNSLVGKNDLFTLISLVCPSMYNDPYYKALSDNNFELYPYNEDDTSLVRFIRSPEHK